MTNIDVIRYDRLSPGTPPMRSMKMRNSATGRDLRRAAARKKRKEAKK